MAVNKIEPFNLNGHAVFYIRKYEPFLALEILGDLQTKFLAPLAALMESADETASEDTKMKYIFDGIDRLSRNLDGKSLVTLSKIVLNGEYISVEIDKEPVERLTENLLNRAIEDVGEVVELIIKVLEVNYKSVFTRAMSRIGAARARPTLN